MTQPAPNFGSTIWTGTNFKGEIDIDPTGLQATGINVLAQRLVLRQTTPLGSVADSPNSCFDINDWVSLDATDATLAQLPSQIQTELMKDSQVLAVTVSVNFVPATSTLTVQENIQSALGPFALTLTITPGNVQTVIQAITNGGS